MLHFRQPKGLVFRTVKARFNSKPLKVQRIGKRYRAPVDLRRYKPSTFVIRILITTSTKQKLTGKRTYHVCERRTH